MKFQLHHRYIKHAFFAVCFIMLSGACSAQAIILSNDPLAKRLDFSNKKLRLSFDYDHKATISSLIVNGQKVIESSAGIYSELKANGTTYSTLHLSSDPSVKTNADSISITGIVYGNKELTITENWTFHLTDSTIRFDITRNLSAPATIEKASLPVFIFRDTSTWDGAYQDYGGLAWFYLFNKRLDTYGVHSHSSEFWNSTTGNGLSVSVDAPGQQVAMDYSRTADDKIAFSIGTSSKEMLPRYDSGTQRRRFIRDATNVWASYKKEAGTTTQSLTLSWFDFNNRYGRGDFVGINGSQVSAVLNTIARIGVIDKQHFGGNSWHTPYGPICLHEQYIAQLGLAINDSSYLKGYRECLDFYRDNAIKPDGRVWPRWAYTNEDMMPGEVNEKGFYEAQWGYLLDANPDLVSNVAELFGLTGDLPWANTHKLSCEKALDWILKRDSNNNGLVEMITDSYRQKKGSDWLDIIWASYENAFVNAKLYHALILWAAVEKQLGDTGKAASYQHYAEQLKTAFNKPIAEGGFWDPEKKCYIHWRDKDGSIHGDNMVTPVNFMAIAYGICDDNTRKATILDNIEIQMQKEKLFFWPACMYSYNPGEGNDWQFPFPKYENGDLFLSWGSIAVKAYAGYKPEIAIKYVNNVLAQYAKDGLAFQRYGRSKQDGLGDDILSGNSLSVVGLYQAIYGINPLYNRFYLDPHITQALSGTKLNYNFRGQRLSISLNINKYTVSNDHYKITAATNFGFYGTDTTLSYFNGNTERTSLKLTMSPNTQLTLDINAWARDKIDWTQSAQNNISYEVNDLKPGTAYTIFINGKPVKKLKTDPAGTLVFSAQPHQTLNNQNDHFLIVCRIFEEKRA